MAGSSEKEILERIVQARKLAGLNQQEASVEIGVSHRQYQDYEAGKPLPWSRLDLIAEKFGVTRFWLLTGVHEGAGDVDIVAQIAQMNEKLVEMNEVILELLRRYPADDG